MPALGIVGAALSKLLATLFSFWFIMYNLRKIFEWHFDVEALKKAWVSSVMMGLIVLATQQLYAGRFYLPMYIMVGGVSYFVFMRLLHAFNASDIGLVKGFLPRRLAFVVDALKRLLIA
jgi:hypothetical protein